MRFFDLFAGIEAGNSVTVNVIYEIAKSLKEIEK